jgi:predicted nuclease of predicted toxin-antitoxin system
MRFLVDENIARSAVRVLRELGHEVEFVSDGLKGSSDASLSDRAHRADQILVSLDLDFGELAVREHRNFIGVIILRSALFARNPAELAEGLRQCVEDDTRTFAGYLTVIEPGRIRQRALDGDTDDA